MYPSQNYPTRTQTFPVVRCQVCGPWRQACCIHGEGSRTTISPETGQCGEADTAPPPLPHSEHLSLADESVPEPSHVFSGGLSARQALDGYP